jgi:hypothetical protein
LMGLWEDQWLREADTNQLDMFENQIDFE